MAADLSKEDLERATKSYNVYDVEQTNKLDAILIMDALRSLGLNPTSEVAMALGATTVPGEKTVTLDEFLEIFARGKKEIYNGTMEDYVGLLELYDRRGKGKIALADLVYILQNMGEKLPEEDVNYVLRIGAPKPDSNGEIAYAKFLTKFLGLEMKNNPYAEQYESAIELVEQKKAARDAEKALQAKLEAEAKEAAKQAALEARMAEKAAAAAAKAVAKAAAKGMAPPKSVKSPPPP